MFQNFPKNRKTYPKENSQEQWKKTKLANLKRKNTTNPKKPSKIETKTIEEKVTGGDCKKTPKSTVSKPKLRRRRKTENENIKKHNR